jgi:hypothetical protein
MNFGATVAHDLFIRCGYQVLRNLLNLALRAARSCSHAISLHLFIWKMFPAKMINLKLMTTMVLDVGAGQIDLVARRRLRKKVLENVIAR